MNRVFFIAMTFLLILATAYTIYAAEQSAPGQKVYRLRELLDRDWQEELIDRDFSAENEACHRDSLALYGPQGRQAVQLSKVELYPGTEYIRSARISFLADLAANEISEWRLTYGPEAIEPWSAPETDVLVMVEEGEIKLENRHLSMRLPAGDEKYSTPIAASEAPGPVLGIGFGEELGLQGSSLYGTALLSSWSGKVVADGPVFGEAQLVYSYADGREMTLTVRLAAGDRRSYWSMFVAPHDMEEALKLLHLPGFHEGAELVKRYIPDDGWSLDMASGIPELRVFTRAEFGKTRWGERVYKSGKWVMEEVDVPLEQEPDGTIISLVPWLDWWDDMTRPNLSFNTAEKGEIFAILANEPGKWVEPAKPGTWITWGNPRQRQKWVPITRHVDGGVAMEFNLASGWRHWIVESRRDGKVQEPTLNTFAELIVEWPDDGKIQHPHLYMTPDQLDEVQKRGGPEPALLASLDARVKGINPMPHGSDADALGMYLLSGTPEMAEATRVVERLERHLELMGKFDTMRSTALACGLYDGLIGTDLIPREKVLELRARMAYLGYFLSSPINWSMERGYCSGNLNMSVAHVLNAGLLACTIADHPMADNWIEPALALTKKWLREDVGPGGEWPESVSNYAYVSATHLYGFVIAARNAGFADYINDINMRRLALYLSKQYTPPDPRGGGQRQPGLKALPPLGRAGAGARWGLDGLMAFATQDSDPELSRKLQWSWLGTGKSRGGIKLGGFEYVVLDPELPAEIPDWTYDVFPHVGAIMRHGIGTGNEWYLNFMCNYSFGYMSESGQFPVVFAFGAPISSRFAGGYAEREALLISRVLPARAPKSIEERYENFDLDSRHRMTLNADLPRQDYLEADITMLQPRKFPPFGGHNHPVEAPAWPDTPVADLEEPINWIRQMLFIKDSDPAKTGNYIVLRDTVSGGQPTMWQWWAVSDRIVTTAESADREAALSNAPGNANAPAVKLEGDSFTALGPFGVDTDFFVAAPLNTPRHTLRFGREYHYSPIHQWNEFMDLLHLQRPDDGAYFVVVYPRRPDSPTPKFSTLGDGYVVSVNCEFGADYTFLSDKSRTVSANGVVFSGTAGGVQERIDGLVLSLSAPGSIKYGDYAIECDQPVSLLVYEDSLRIHLSKASPGTMVDIKAPGNWTIDTGQGSTIREIGDQRWRLKLMQDVKDLELVQL